MSIQTGENIDPRDRVMGLTEDKYKAIFELSPEAIILVSKKGDILDINRRVTDWLQYESKELIGRNLLKLPFLPPKSKSIVKKKFLARMLGKKIAPYELDFVAKNGDVRVGRVMASPIKNEKGKIVNDLVMIADVTTERKSAEALKESEKRFQDIAFSSADWIWETGKDGRYTFASGRVKEVLGYESEELIGKLPFDLMPPDEAKRVGEVFQKIVAQKAPISDLENLNLSKGGKKVWLLTNGVPVLNDRGELMGYRGTGKDITKSKQIREELDEKISELERINELLVGRELKMVKLKKKLAKIENK